MNRSLVETCVLGLNHMNHALLFGEAPDNENAYQRGKKNAQSGATCSTPCGAAVYQGRSAEAAPVLPCSGQWSDGQAEVGL